jgi:hypothetical protein
VCYWWSRGEKGGQGNYDITKEEKAKKEQKIEKARPRIRKLGA